jgi:hypothetical protein
MSLRHLSAPRLRRSLLLTSLLLAGSFSAHAAEEMLRKAVGKGAYEMAYSQQENALWVATSQSRSLDKGGIVYRLDPTTLEVTQIIHNDLKPFGATINNATQTLWFGNTTDSTVTAIDAKTGAVKGRLVLTPVSAAKPCVRWPRASWRSMRKPTPSTSPGWVKRA